MKRTTKIILFSLFSLILLASLFNVKSVNANPIEVLVTGQNETGTTTGIPIYGNNWYAQTFTSSFDFYLTKVSHFLAKSGSPTGNLIISIKNTINGLPSGPDIVNATIDYSNIVYYSFRNVTFSTQPKLLAGVTYAIVIRLNGGDENNFIAWETNWYNPYPNGAMICSTNGGVTWTVDSYNRDFCFKVYGNIPEWNYVESWNGILHTIGWYAVESWFGSLVGWIWSLVEVWAGSIVGKCWSFVEVWRGVFPELPMFYVRSVMLYVGLGGLFCFMPLLGFAGKKRSLGLLLFAFVLLFISWALLYAVSVTTNY
jgi:hypothetical protein